MASRRYVPFRPDFPLCRSASRRPTSRLTPIPPPAQRRRGAHQQYLGASGKAVVRCASAATLCGAEHRRAHGRARARALPSSDSRRLFEHSETERVNSVAGVQGLSLASAQDRSSMTSPSTSMRARCWASSASRAAARPWRCGPSSGCCRRRSAAPRGASTSKGRIWRRLRQAHCVACAAPHRHGLPGADDFAESRTHDRPPA